MTILICGECGKGYYHRTPAGATCDTCGHVVSVELDIRPNLDAGEEVRYNVAEVLVVIHY